MIRYDLICCDCEAEFKAWFSNSSSFDEQKEKGLVTCIACSGGRVSKAIMAPSVNRTDRNAASDPAAMAQSFIRRAKRHIAENYDFVGSNFADEARAIHRGEREERAIWGQATAEESAALAEEGVDAAPLPEAITPDVPKSDSELN